MVDNSKTLQVQMLESLLNSVEGWSKEKLTNFVKDELIEQFENQQYLHAQASLLDKYEVQLHIEGCAK